MKTGLWTVIFLVVLGLGAQRVQAQVYYDPYYNSYLDTPQYPAPVQDSYPYYQLEALHYRVYVPYFQSYPIYPYYQPCCIAGPLIVAPPTVIIPRPVIGGPRVVRRR